MKNVYELELHESCEIKDGLIATRVPGGWIYEIQKPQANILETVFIPFNNEFNKRFESMSPYKIVKFVENYFNLPIPLNETKSREGNYPLSRQFICKLLTDNTSISNVGIAGQINYKNGCNVPNSLKSLNNLFETDKKVLDQYKYIRDNLNLK